MSEIHYHCVSALRNSRVTNLRKGLSARAKSKATVGVRRDASSGLGVTTQPRTTRWKCDCSFEQISGGRGCSRGAVRTWNGGRSDTGS
jgi:hypothetical protein